MVTGGRTAALEVVAVDQARNRTRTSLAVQVITDTTAPAVLVISPANGASVPSAGFLLQGSAADEFGVAGLTATLDDPLLGRSVSRPLALAADGSWSLAVLRGQVSEGQTVLVTVTATDPSGNRGTVVRDLPVVGVGHLVHHVANRVTFGASPTQHRLQQARQRRLRVGRERALPPARARPLPRSARR
jgi:hypothetical protein